MTSTRVSSVTGFPVVFAICCVVAVSVEAYLVFADREASFSIEGRQPYNIEAFAEGQTVAHSFLMRGDGLQSVSLRFVTDKRAVATVKWALWTGHPDDPGNARLAFERTELFDLRVAREWRTLSFPRDGSSHDKWYTIRVDLLKTSPASAKVALMATQDNPDRGGVLWVNGFRRPGSLVMRANRRGRTPYRRFVVDAEPNLPPMLQIRGVQLLIVAIYHAALFAFCYAVLRESFSYSPVRRSE